jgi:hypothetical protein
MVPENWEHPKGHNGKFKPLMNGYSADLKEFKELIEKEGIEYALEYFGGGPLKDDYMPDWSDEEKTHLMMYETTSEGTPISPSFKTPEELAHWLADTNASAFGNMTATYDEWLSTCRAGWAPSGMWSPETGLISGVKANTLKP